MLNYDNIKRMVTNKKFFIRISKCECRQELKSLNSFTKISYKLIDSMFNFSKIERDRACLLLNGEFYESDYHSEIISELFSIDEETAEIICQSKKENLEVITFDIVLCEDYKEYLVAHHQDFLSKDLEIIIDYCSKNNYVLGVYYTEGLKVKSKLVDT